MRRWRRKKMKTSKLTKEVQKVKKKLENNENRQSKSCFGSSHSIIMVSCSKGPILSWIPSEIDIIFLVKIWKHEESKVPNVEGFVL